MKTIGVLIAALALAAAAPVLAQQPTRTVAARCCRAPANTVVMIELAGPLSTKSLKAGDTFPIRLADPLIVGGRILLPAGTPGVGEVVDASKPGFGGKGAKLVLDAKSLKPRTGGPIRLKGFQLGANGRDHATVATALGAGGIGFAPLGVVGFVIKGEDVTLPEGSKATAKLAANTTLPSLGRAPKNAKSAPLPKTLQEAKSAIDIPPPAKGMGQVVFFRKKSLLGTGQWFNVREDNTALGKLTNGVWFVQSVTPGTHTFTAKTEPEFKDQLKLKIDAGETYFVEGVLTKGVVIGIADLTPSDAPSFAAASKDLKPAGEDQLKEEPAAKAAK